MHGSGKVRDLGSGDRNRSNTFVSEGNLVGSGFFLMRGTNKWADYPTIHLKGIRNPKVSCF